MECHNRITRPDNNSNATNWMQNQPEERRTLDQLGGICCWLCDDNFTDKRQIDQHFRSVHLGKHIDYTCVLCYQVFTNYKTFHDHCYRHVSGKRFYCEKCHKQFYYQAYQLHMEKFHLGDKKTTKANENEFNCKHCSKKYDNFRDLAQHLRYCNRDYLYSCHICQKTFTEKSFLLRHLPRHSDARDFECTSCEACFKTKRDLVKHQAYQHDGKDLNFQCDECHKNFLTSTKLKMHMNTHTEQKPYSCDYCSSAFTNHPNRIKHIKRVHSLKCPHAQLTLIEKMSDVLLDSDEKTPAELNDRIEVHGTVHTGDGEERFSCGCCPMRFSYRRSWLRHMKRNHLKYKYSCNQCQKTIVCPDPIESYDSILSSESSKPFICDYCSAGFTDKSNLQRHIARAGHLECTHRCSVCAKAFISASQLRSHVKVHKKSPKQITSVVALTKVNKEAVKDFRCRYCDQYFTYSRSMLRHMKRKHMREMQKSSSFRSKNKEDFLEIQLKIFKEFCRQHEKGNKTTNSNPNGVANQQGISNLKVPNEQISQTPQSNYAPGPYALAVPVIQPIVIVLPSETSATANSFQNEPGIVNTAGIPVSDFNDKTETAPNCETGGDKPDEVDSELLSYLNSYIRGNNDLDILKDTIDIPGLAEEPNNLDTLTADLILQNGLLDDGQVYDHNKQNTSETQLINCDSTQHGIKHDDTIKYSNNLSSLYTMKEYDVADNIQRPLKLHNVPKAVPRADEVSAWSHLCEYTSQFIVDTHEQPKSHYRRLGLEPAPVQSVSHMLDLEDVDLLPIDPHLTMKARLNNRKETISDYLPNVRNKDDIQNGSIEELISSIINYTPSKTFIPSYDTPQYGVTVNNNSFEGIEMSYNADSIDRSADWMNYVPDSSNRFPIKSFIEM